MKVPIYLQLNSITLKFSSKNFYIEHQFILFNKETGIIFLDKLKDRLGKAYLLRLEEMGVNLYLLELRIDLI